jgi:microsomal dipeptidase-like Zn-dependent dipeptidase
MKTTLDLPDDLVKRVKIRAIHEHKKLKEAIAELIERGMNESSLAKIPKPLKLRRGFVPTAKDIEAAIAEGRE